MKRVGKWFLVRLQKLPQTPTDSKQISNTGFDIRRYQQTSKSPPMSWNASLTTLEEEEFKAETELYEDYQVIRKCVLFLPLINYFKCVHCPSACEHWVCSQINFWWKMKRRKSTCQKKWKSLSQMGPQCKNAVFVSCLQNVRQFTL